MGCNIASNVRRKKWQNFQPENSPCKCDLGFAAAGCVPREYWIRWDTAQLDPKWLWLNAGFVLTYDQTFPGNGCLYVAGAIGGNRITLLLGGSNDPFDFADQGIVTVRATLVVSVGPSPPVVGLTFTDADDDGAFSPQPTKTWDFPAMTTLFPVPGLPSTIVGQAFASPLKPCHNCT